MGTPTWPDLTTRLVGGFDLTGEQVQWAMGEILLGAASPVQVAGFAVALRAKGETVEELSAMADVMLEFATPITLDRDAVDVVGTGGDRANTVNVSTMAAIAAAAAGAKVVKHGNRAASSACGTADVLEHVGLVLDLPPSTQQGVMDRAGLVFLFAAGYHSSLRHVSSVRRELGISTTFNFLGPMANPARPNAQAIGVADPRMAPLIAGVLAGRGARGLIFHGGDGLDELTTTTTSRVWVIRDGEIRETVFDPLQLDIPRAEVADLVGGPPATNAWVLHETLNGKNGPVQDIVALNAAAALLAFEGPALDIPVHEQLASRLERARDVLTDGRAASKLEDWVGATQAARDLPA
ncbi:MAG TPA: anthranilate phosphoribosyltransferase [Propionibacterium sp.]|jgi:anthranilate phosphoribosyltransferase|nr:anthranilate phosphoribosyltransferase [Propionibacterium sp.]